MERSNSSAVARKATIGDTSIHFGKTWRPRFLEAGKRGVSGQLQLIRSDAKCCNIEIVVSVDYAITQMQGDRSAGTTADHSLDKSWQLAICETLFDNVTGCHCKDDRPGVKKKY